MLCIIYFLSYIASTKRISRGKVTKSNILPVSSNVAELVGKLSFYVELGKKAVYATSLSICGNSRNADDH